MDESAGACSHKRLLQINRFAAYRSILTLNVNRFFYTLGKFIRRSLKALRQSLIFDPTRHRLIVLP
jgi:hypothetical protein